MSNLSPAAVLYDSSGNEKGVSTNPVSVDGVVTSTLVETDSFGTAVVGSRYNQVEVAFDQLDPDAITTITVTKSNGGDASNSAGQAVFTTGTATNGGIKAVTNTNISYRPQAEVYAAFTCIFTAGVADSYQRIGIYDASDGFFIGYEGTAFGLTIRKGGVDTRTARASFSLDPLTGGASSKYTRNGTPESMDPTKDQLYRIRFGWLGAAPITFEILSPDGKWVPFHVYKHPNTVAATTVNNPDLPITLDAQKTAGATNITMNTACWAAGTTSDLAPVTSTVTANSLASLTRAVITGQTTAGGGGFVNVKVNPSGALAVAADLTSYGGTAVGAGNALHVQPGTGAVFPVSDNGGSLTVDGTVTANQGGTWNINNVSGTVSLPTGASTAANQTTLGSQTTKINDGTNTVAVKAASTAALATDPSIVTAFSPNSPLPTGTNEVGAVKQGTAAALSGRWPVEVTDGTNVMPTGDAVGRAVFHKLTDGTDTASVAPASTAAQANETALVVGLSPNSPLPTGTNSIGTVTAVQATAANLNALAAQGSAAALSGKWPVQHTDGTNTLPTADVAGRALFSKVTDGTNTTAVKAASTAALAADPSLVTAFSPNSPLPVGTNEVGKVAQGTAAALTGYWPVRHTDGTNTLPTADVAARAMFAKVTDGTNTLPTGDVAARSIYTRVSDGTNVMPVGDVASRAPYNRITDGTNTAAVKAASTPATLSDPSLVVQISPNQDPIPTSIVPTNAFSGNSQGRTPSTAANTFVPIRQTTYTEQTTNGQRSFTSSSANDSSAGTGARQVRIEYLDQNGNGPSLLEPFYTETVTLNGTTAVNTVATNICFIEHMEVVSVGSGGSNAGTITLFTGTGGTGTAIGTIATGNITTGIGDNESLWAHHYVPNLFETAIYAITGGCTAAAGGGNYVQVLKGKHAVNATAAEALVGDIITVAQGNAFLRSFGAPLLFTGPYRLVLYGTPGSNNTTMYGSFDYSDRPA